LPSGGNVKQILTIELILSEKNMRWVFAGYQHSFLSAGKRFVLTISKTFPISTAASAAASLSFNLTSSSVLVMEE
jgi:hypothetical protein